MANLEIIIYKQIIHHFVVWTVVLELGDRDVTTAIKRNFEDTL